MTVATVLLTAILVVITLGIKVLRGLNKSLRKRYRRRIEPALEVFLSTGEVPSALARLKPWEKEIFLSPLMVERMALLRGADRERLALLAADLGLVERHTGGLGSRRRWTRARAAESLGYFGGEETVKLLGTMLSREDEDDTVRAVAARALARIGTEGAAEALARTLDVPSELTRLRVAENLERLGELSVTPLSGLLLTLTTDGAVMAAQVLGNLRDRKARPALGSVLLHTQDGDVLAQATLALGKIGDPDDLPFILRSAESEFWPARAQSANALGLIGETSTIPTLEKLAGDPEWWVRLNACKALANMGPSGEKALLQIVKNKDHQARSVAVGVLETNGTTLRAARNLTKSGPKGERARDLTQAVIRTGLTRYLHSLREHLPDSQSQALERLLEDGERLERGQTPTALWRRRLRRCLTPSEEARKNDV